MLQDRSILREFIGYSIIVRMLVFKLYTFDLNRIGFCKNCRGQDTDTGHSDTLIELYWKFITQQELNAGFDFFIHLHSFLVEMLLK